MTTQNAMTALQSLVGTKFTFVPCEKGKDRPAQTLTVKDLVQTGTDNGPQDGLGFTVNFTYQTKRGTVISTDRVVSPSRLGEYLACAAGQGELPEVVKPEPAPKAEPAAEVAAEPKAKKGKKAKQEPEPEPEPVDAEADLAEVDEDYATMLAEA